MHGCGEDGKVLTDMTSSGYSASLWISDFFFFVETFLVGGPSWQLGEGMPSCRCPLVMRSHETSMYGIYLLRRLRKDVSPLQQKSRGRDRFRLDGGNAR